MITSQRQSQTKKPLRSPFRWVALLLVLTLVGHVFEDCTAHFGFPPAANFLQVSSDCAHTEAASCGSCSLHQHRESDSDGCHAQSEIAVLTSSYSLEHPDFAPLDFGVLPATPDDTAFASGSLIGLAQPPPTHFVSSTLRLSLPNRAPPSV